MVVPQQLAPSVHSRAVIRVPETKQVATLLVAVRCRPLTNEERSKSPTRDILRIVDGKVVVVLDPDVSKGNAATTTQRSLFQSYECTPLTTMWTLAFIEFKWHMRVQYILQ